MEHDPDLTTSKKRRTRRGETLSSFPQPSDVYDQISSLDDDKEQEFYEAKMPDKAFIPLDVISSWLCNPRWLSQSTVTETTTSSIQDEIESLTRQLIQVKRRLLPAAEQCAECGDFKCGIYEMNARSEFNSARSNCNPFEVLGERRNGGLGALFLNRAGVKLANIDALINFELTSFQHDHHRQPEPFIFVDLCGAPGGFSEYVIRRCQMEGVEAVLGYGMSLIGKNEYGDGTPWKLNNSTHFENQSLQNYRICDGVDGTGDVFLWENVEALMKLMIENYAQRCSANGGEYCEEAKAHLVLADGGFDAQRDSDDQEAIAQKLIVCEVGAALAVLRTGGTMVIKMFGFQTRVVRAVLADLQSRFQDLIVLKPISSRPASAERYLVCRGFRGLERNWNGPSWRSRMFLGETLVRQPRLFSYLDIFDRDMLRLNLKSCFSILTYLENKQTRDRGWNRQRNAIIRPASYKHAWRLF